MPNNSPCPLNTLFHMFCDISWQNLQIQNFSRPIMRKKGGRSKNINAQRTMIYAEPGISEYGQVTRAFGSGRFEVVCTDSSTRVCKVRGSMYKRVWIQINDIVLVSNREEDNKGDIIHKYFPYEIKQLKDSKLIPENFSGDKENAAAIEFAHI